MNSISISSPSIDSIKTVLTSIGFEEDSESEVLYLSADAEKTIGLKVVLSGSNVVIQAYSSKKAAVISDNSCTLATTAIGRLNYQTLKNGGMAIGLSASSAADLFHLVIVAPDSENDCWCFAGAANNTANTTVYSYDANEQKQVNYASYHTTNSDAVQIVKVYNGTRFLDNVYTTLIHPTDIARYNFRYATVNNKEYILIAFQANVNYNKIAVEV